MWKITLFVCVINFKEFHQEHDTLWEKWFKFAFFVCGNIFIFISSYVYIYIYIYTHLKDEEMTRISIIQTESQI